MRLNATDRCRKYRNERKRNGLCIKCAKPVERNDHVHCDNCLVIEKERSRDRRRLLKNDGLCSCGRKRDDVTKALCNVCRTRSYRQYLTQEYHYRCEHCGVSFVSHEADAKFCCLECCHSFYSGINHYNWNHDRELMSQNSIDRNSVAYSRWRQQVFERDNYACVLCKRRGKYLNAHHIYAFALYPSLRFDVTNGITLCIGCHKDIHVDEEGIQKCEKLLETRKNVG